MKKFICMLLVAAAMLSLSACGAEKAPAVEKTMLDLTRMSSTVMFAELFNMSMEPENYVGRTVRMKGKFAAMPNPVTGAQEYAVLAVDAAACCVQGLDLSLAGNLEHPAVDSEVTVTGTYQKVTENGLTRYRIADAVWE